MLKTDTFYDTCRWQVKLKTFIRSRIPFWESIGKSISQIGRCNLEWILLVQSCSTSPTQCGSTGDPKSMDLDMFLWYRSVDKRILVNIFYQEDLNKHLLSRGFSNWENFAYVETDCLKTDLPWYVVYWLFKLYSDYTNKCILTKKWIFLKITFKFKFIGINSHGKKEIFSNCSTKFWTKTFYDKKKNCSR